jgi:endoribonuclease Dicer
LADYEKTGEAMFTRFYGATASSTQTLLDSAYPDLGYISKTIGYGFIYGFLNYINDVETSYVLLASLVALDAPLQIRWHLDGARRNGATDDQVRAVRSMAIKIAEYAGVLSENEVPDL